MGFQLAEAYVELSSRGLDRVVDQVDRLHNQMGRVSPMVDQANQSINRLSIKGDLINPASLREVEQRIKAIESGVGRGLGESVRRFNSDLVFSSSQTAEITQRFREIREMTAGTGANTSGVARQLGGVVAQTGKTANGWQGILGRVGSVGLKLGSVLGVVGAVAGVAKGIYDSVIRWTEEASGFNAQMVKSVELSEKLAKARNQLTQNSIDDANRLVGVEEKRLAIEKLLKTARLENEAANRNREKADKDRKPGFFGQFGDGKLNSELEPNFERAKVAAEGTARSVEMLEGQLRSLKNQQENYKSNLAEQLKREKILAEEGAEALRKYELIQQGFGEFDAGRLAGQEAFLKFKQQERQEAERIAEAYEQQVAELRLKAIELNQGADAAQMERDRIAGFSEKQVAELARLREKNRLAEEALAVREAEEEAAGKGKLDLVENQSAIERTKQAIEEEKASQSGDKKFSFVGISQLAEQMQQQAQDQQHSQRLLALNEELVRLQRDQNQKLAGEVRTKPAAANIPPTVDHHFGS